MTVTCSHNIIRHTNKHLKTEVKLIASLAKMFDKKIEEDNQSH